MRFRWAKQFVFFGGVSVALMLLLTGCGRTALHSPCDTDADCPPAQDCVDGVCVDPIDPDPNNDEGCTSNLDCGDGTCWEDQGGGCIGEVCNEVTGECVIGPCAPTCDDDETPVGCNCVPDECDSDADCGGGICADGSCRPCFGDAECSDDGSVICQQGVCVDNVECTVDNDCRPHEECRDEVCVLRPECTFDEDCGEDERCVGGVCTYTPECETDDDCGAQAECVGGYCQAEMCRGNDECPDDQLCDAGECVDPPVALWCEVVTSSQSIVPDEQITLEAFAYDAYGNGVAAQYDWSSSNESVAEVEGNQLVGGTEMGTTTVTATLATGDPIVCDGSAEIENIGFPGDGELRVHVEHIQTGEPISGAEVYVDGISTTTSGGGIAEFPDPGGSYDVTVFHEDYDYLTVLDVSEDDIRIPLSPQSGTGPVAGFTGEFDNSAIHTTGDIELGMAGASLAGDLLDIDLTTLFGDMFYTEFEVPGMGGADVPMPGGVTAHGEVFGFQVEGKQTYYAQSPGGPRLAWGIAGQLPFQEMLDLFMDPPTDVAGAIGTILPLFSRFDHAQQPKVLEPLPRVLDTEDINNSGDTSEWLPDYNNFPEIDLMPSVRQDLTTQVDISSLPTLGGEQAEVAVLLGGMRADELGVVPLGISATADEDGDGQPESRTLYMAPPYGSAVGGRYTVTAISFGGGGAEPGGGLGDGFSMALWNGQTLATEISMGTFPDSSTGSVHQQTRTVEVDDAEAGPIFRIRMVGQQRSWDVWSAGEEKGPGQYSAEIEIPEVPADRTDLFETGAEVLVDGIRTNVSIDDLAGTTNVGLHRAGLVTTTFNRTPFQ